jgi:hypothetical protein
LVSKTKKRRNKSNNNTSIKTKTRMKTRMKITVKTTVQRHHQWQRHPRFDHRWSIDEPLNDKPTKTSWLLKLLCSDQSPKRSPKHRADNKQRHTTLAPVPAPRFSTSGSTSSYRFGMDWFLSPQAQRIYKQ